MNKEKKNSIILIAALLIIAVVLVIFSTVNKRNAAFVIVTSDGKEVMREEIDKLSGTYTIDSQYGTNILEIVVLEDGSKGIRCIEADCPEHICIKTGIITNENDTIVCLPHKMTVRLIK